MNFRFGFHIVIFYQLFLLVLNYSYAIDKIIDMDSIEEDQGEICKDLVSSCADRVLAGQCHDHPEWMGANCARACRFCQNIDDAVPLDTPHYSCHDIDTKCHIRRLNGQCEEYLDWSRINCEWTCDLCRVEHHLSDCEDKDERCAERAADGQCNVRNIYMIRHCPKSCNLCHKKYRREKVEVIVETVEEVIDEEGQPIVIVDYCVDKNYVTDCKRRAELGQWNSNFLWMHTNCWKTCGCQTHNFYPEIHDLDDINCKDSVKDCVDLKDRNFCNTHRLLMTKNCPKTCGMCRESYESSIPCVNLENDICQNLTDEQCSKYPSHMLGCAADCGTCHLMDPEVRCHPLVLGIDVEEYKLKKGGITEIFRILTSRFSHDQHTDVTVLSKDPWVVQVDEFIDEHTVERLLESADGWIDDARADLSEAQRLEEGSAFARKASKFGMGRDTDEVDSAMLMDLSHLFEVPMANFEYAHFYHYKEGTSQKDVHEYFEEHQHHIYSNAFIAGLVFLSDDVKGGDLVFNELGKTVSPALGRMVMWAVARDQNVTAVDRRTVHMHTPVVSGNKVLATFSIHLGDYRTTTQWRC